MSDRSLPRILCVDDEARVLEGLVLHLRKDYEVHTATSGEQALAKLREMRGAAVVLSDMRMPVMDGATLLQQVMQLYPDATRILLTGDPGRDVAVSAVNRGQIYRFLTKPCPPEQLKAAVEAGVMQHRLVNAERTVLQETLIGCLDALSDVLAMTSPTAFGRANRVKRLAVQLAEALDCGRFWQLEAAALLSQIGYLSLSPALVEKLYYGGSLTPDEEQRAADVPSVAIKLLEHIPRLEPVMHILVALSWKDDALVRVRDGMAAVGARVLGLALEYDALVSRGLDPASAVQSLRRRAVRYGEELLDHLASIVGASTPSDSSIREVPLRSVTPGMVMMQELRTHNGTLLVPRGFEITPTFLQRVRNFDPELLLEHVKVRVPDLRPGPPGEGRS